MTNSGEREQLHRKHHAQIMIFQNTLLRFVKEPLSINSSYSMVNVVILCKFCSRIIHRMGTLEKNHDLFNRFSKKKISYLQVD